MSSCKAPNCDLKNFDQCNSSLQFCLLQGIGIGEEESSRDCNPKDTGIVNYFRTDEECKIISSVNAEFECGKKVGCEWGYPSIATNDLLEKKCIPNRKGPRTTTGVREQASYTCSQTSGDTTLGSWKIGDEEVGRYSMEEQDTFGCPKDKCNYIPRKSPRVDGACSGPKGCESHTTKELCLTTETSCKWNPNDSAYCGYNRTIKKTLGGGTTNLDTFTLADDENNVCRKITNPSEEVCNHWGCIWDIKGERNSDVDYDITTSGICMYPDTGNCKNNYCSQNTRSSESGKRRGYHPDGRCKGGVVVDSSRDKCEPSGEMIIPHKTPGLMKLSGHTSDENTEISNLQRVIDKKHKTYKEALGSGHLNDLVGEGGVVELGERNKFKNEIKGLYHQSCEKRGKYPGPADPMKEFNPNEYDVSLKECRNRSGASNILDLCGMVKSNYESNEYKPYLDYHKSGKCLFTGYEGDEADPANRSPAMKAAAAECPDGDCPSPDNQRDILEYGMNKCISAETGRLNDSRSKCINVNFGGVCKNATSLDLGINTEAECTHYRWVPRECGGQATEVPAKCTGTATDAGETCDLDVVTDATADCPLGCTSAEAHTPDCGLDADTDNGCIAGCTPSAFVCRGNIGAVDPVDLPTGADGGPADEQACKLEVTGNTWTGEKGYCQWHAPGERCRVKEESFNILECSPEDSHPLCVQNRRSDEPINESSEARKTEAMKIRCSTDCHTQFTPAGAEGNSTDAQNSCEGVLTCTGTSDLSSQCSSDDAEHTTQALCEAAGSCDVQMCGDGTEECTTQETCVVGGTWTATNTWTAIVCSEDVTNCESGCDSGGGATGCTYQGLVLETGTCAQDPGLIDQCAALVDSPNECNTGSGCVFTAAGEEQPASCTWEYSTNQFPQSIKPVRCGGGDADGIVETPATCEGNGANGDNCDRHTGAAKAEGLVEGPSGNSLLICKETAGSNFANCQFVASSTYLCSSLGATDSECLSPCTLSQAVNMGCHEVVEVEEGVSAEDRCVSMVDTDGTVGICVWDSSAGECSDADGDACDSAASEEGTCNTVSETTFGGCTWNNEILAVPPTASCEPIDPACNGATQSRSVCEAEGFCKWTAISDSQPELCSLVNPEKDECTEAYEGNGMCLNRDGEKVTCRIGTDPAIYVSRSKIDSGECPGSSNLTTKDNCEALKNLGYHWYLPPVSNPVRDGCRNILADGRITDTCASKWISNDGSLKQHLKCRKNYYQIHSYFKAEIKTILDGSGSGDREDRLYNFLIGRKQDGSQEATAYWELQEQYRSKRHVGVGCVGQIPATCTGPAEACAEAAVLSVTADAEACAAVVLGADTSASECAAVTTAADSTAVACSYTAASAFGSDEVTSCDLDPNTGGTCPSGCTDTAAVPCAFGAGDVCSAGCIHIHGTPDCDDECENIKHKIRQIMPSSFTTINYKNDEIINNLAHYFITLIQIKDSFGISDSASGIELDYPLPIISQGDKVQFVSAPGQTCSIVDTVDTNRTIDSIDGSGKTLTISGITATEGCKLKVLPNCKYDVARNLYRVNSDESSKHAGLYQLSIEDYPIITPEQGDISGDRVISDNWLWKDDNKNTITIGSENYKHFLSDPEEMKHIIKDIKYATGKATILLEITNNINEAVPEETINEAFKLLKELKEIPFTVEGGKQPKIKLKEQHPLVSVKRYFDGMIEIEIDGVDPGRIENDKVEYPRDMYNITLNDFDNDKVHVREIRFHDIQMDIYFDSDIHNLYKKNDIIEIEKLQDSHGYFEDNFNRAYRLKPTSSGDGPIYNKITDVDFIKNKITVDHIKRKYSGKYFPGRYRTEPKGCIVEKIGSGVGDTPGSSFGSMTGGVLQDYVDIPGPHCDYKRDVWNDCLKVLPGDDSIDCFDGTRKKCRHRQINVENIGLNTYCMKNGVEEVICVSGQSSEDGDDIHNLSGDSVLISGWGPPSGELFSIDEEWNGYSLSSLIIQAESSFNLMINQVVTEAASDAATDATAVATLKNVTNFQTKVDEEDFSIVTPDDFLSGHVREAGGTENPDPDLQIYSTAIKGVTKVLNKIKGLIDEFIEVSQFVISESGQYITLSKALKAIEDILKKNNKHISHLMNNGSKTNMIKVNSDYATQVQELLKPRGDETRPTTIKLLMGDRIVCAGITEEGADVLGTKTFPRIGESGESDTYIIIDEFIDTSALSCKLEIEPAGNFEGFKCIPNDVRFNGIIEDGNGDPLAKNFSCNELQHKYDLPNRLERNMCSQKRRNNDIHHESMFEVILNIDDMVFERNDDGDSSDFGKYTAPHGIFSTIFKDNDLNGWVIEYIEKTTPIFSEREQSGSTSLPISQKGTGIIKDFTSTEDNYIFNIYTSTTSTSTPAIKLEIKNILPLSIYEKVNGFDKGIEGAVGAERVGEDNKRAFTIKNYIRKDVNELHMMETIPNIGYGTERLKYFPGINTRSTCEYNNGIWEGLECKSHDVSSRVRNTDICENTGYNWEEKMNVCMLDGEYNSITNPTETIEYCQNKTVQNPNDGENPPTNPCPTCKYDGTLDVKICRTQDEDDCMKHTTKELCAADKTCEYYIDRMETPGPGLKPQAIFNCEEKSGSVGDSSVCITKTNRPDCEGAKCEWQCPFTPDSRNQQGYVVKTSIDGVSDPNPTLNNQTDNYYAPSDLTVTCDTTWEQSETSVDPSITCIENVDPDPRVDEHTHRMASVGCRPKINCGENKIDDEPITGEVLRSLDLNQVPDVFKIGTGSDEAIDPTKTPDSQGSFKCPAPQTLRDNASGIAFWSKEQCCYSTGLCKNNTEPGDDVECPTGKIHKKAYYGESTEYLPAQGTTQEVCCIVPEVPTITIPLDADYDEIAGSAGTTLRDTFEQNFCTDIVTILNASDHIDVPITSSMCEILDINDGSIVVTFRLNKDTNGNVVLTDQLSKAISSGTTFPTVGAVSNAEPHYKPYDPKAKYLFWSDTLKKGITIEQLIITIFMIVCIISSGLAVMGILLK